jgi:hypothetical protein
MGALGYRLLGALRLDPRVFEEVESRRAANSEALVIVLVSSIAAGVGAGSLDGPSMARITGFGAIALGSWLAWSGMILHVGGRLFPEAQTRVTYGQLIRTIGFAATPGLLQVFAIFEPIRMPVFIVAWLWMLAAMVVAVRQALDYRTPWHAFGVCIISLAVVVSAVVVLGLALSQVVS